MFPSTAGDGGVNTKVVMLLQYLNVANQHDVHLELIQCFMPMIFQ